MKCPSCNKELKLNMPVLHNVESYGTPVRATTNCCHTIITVGRKISFSTSIYTGPEIVDSWGNPGEKKTMRDN